MQLAYFKPGPMIHIFLGSESQEKHLTYADRGTFPHDLLLGVGLLIQNAQLIIAVNEHDACVVPVLHSALVLLHAQPQSGQAAARFSDVWHVSCSCALSSLTPALLP